MTNGELGALLPALGADDDLFTVGVQHRFTPREHGVLDLDGDALAHGVPSSPLNHSIANLLSTNQSGRTEDCTHVISVLGSRQVSVPNAFSMRCWPSCPRTQAMPS